MADAMGRREFLKAAALGTAGMAAAGLFGTSVFAGETEAVSGETPSRSEQAVPFKGKKKFAGVGSVRKVSDDTYYIGASDKRLELFENVYPIPRGISYNSYIIFDE